jgi:biopolymer transport protein ExbD
MRRRKPHGESGEEADAAIAPLIDCVFLLLIFFLVSTMLKKLDRDIDIELPVSESAERHLPSNNQTVVGIEPGGDLFLNGRPSDIMELHRVLRDIGIESPGWQIRVDTDRSAPLHRVVEVVDLCQFHNLDDVVIRAHDEYYNRR